jgi:Chloroplast import apparatus Tic20-like
MIVIMSLTYDSGLVAFIVLNFLSNNLQINRLVRFNLQQAILVDVGLIVPGLLSGIAAVIIPYFGVTLSPEITLITSTATFGFFLVLITYACLSSLAGVTPNKIPLISERVEKRMPKMSDLFDAMNEARGRDQNGPKGPKPK